MTRDILYIADALQNRMFVVFPTSSAMSSKAKDWAECYARGEVRLPEVPETHSWHAAWPFKDIGGQSKDGSFHTWSDSTTFVLQNP